MSGTPPTALVLLVAFLAALPLVAAVSARLRLPYTVVLVLVGLGVSALPIRNALDLAPGTIVTILLPGLVFEAAFKLDAGELRRTFPGVALLAVPGVVVSAAVVAAILNLGGGLPLAEAFVVGAIVSATDPVAVVSTMRRVNAPRRLVTLVDAESLFNDGTAALLFVVALAFLDASHAPSIAAEAVTFVADLVVSTVIGLVAGYVISRAMAMTKDHLIELTLTVLAAYGTYLLADVLHQSGIIASVVAGVVVGTYGKTATMSDRGADIVDEVWDFLAFELTGAAFLLIGLAIPIGSLVAAPAVIAWGVVAVLLARALVVYGMLGALTGVLARLRVRRAPPLAWLHVLNWTALRGAVAVALALAMPQDVIDRTVLQGAVFGIVLFTLLVQGTTAGWMLRRLGVQGGTSTAGEPAGAASEGPAPTA